MIFAHSDCCTVSLSLFYCASVTLSNCHTVNVQDSRLINLPHQASKHEKEKKSPTFKDLDFLELLPEGLLLEPETYTALISTMRRDCRVLESFKVASSFHGTSPCSLPPTSSSLNPHPSRSWTTPCCWGSTTWTRPPGREPPRLRLPTPPNICRASSRNRS